MKTKSIFFAFVLLLACKNKTESIQPTEQGITESVYASGIVKAKNQYQAFATANGIIREVYVEPGDTVRAGQPILKVFNQTQQLNRENAELSARFADLAANQGKLKDAKMQSDLALTKYKNDSLLFDRQKKLFAQNIGTQVELEQRELGFLSARTAYYSSVVRLDDLKRQLQLTAGQTQRNLEISSTLEGEYILKSEINGVVFDLLKEKGEIVGPQTPLAIIGDANHYVLEMQIDEYDIFKIKTGLKVLVSLDSYRNKVFEARITKVYPIMNERSKTFLAEAEFVTAPNVLYPNVTFEANLLVKEKSKAVLIPRNCLLNDSTVLLANGEERHIKTGLKDYKMIEVLSGLSVQDQLQKPKK